MRGKLLVLMVFLVSVLALATVALPSITKIEIDGNEVSPFGGETIEVERGADLPIEVKVVNYANVTDENVEIEAQIIGYEYNDREAIFDRVHIFDLDAGDTVYKDMNLKVPTKMDADKYDLRVMISSRTGPAYEMRYTLHVKGERHSVEIKDLVLNPSDSVVAGRALLATVRVKNNGEKDEDSVKVTVKIPALGLEASDYIDTLEAGDSATSEELYLRIPTCADAGTYRVDAVVEYDEKYETEVISQDISVESSEVCGPVTPDDGAQVDKTIITIPESQDVVKGTGGVVYPIMIANLGKSAKTYTISVSGIEAFGTYRIDPGNVVVVKSGETKTAYVYVTANDNAAAGERAFIVSVATDKETQQIPLTAKVVEPAVSSWSKMRKGLEIGLVVLVVILLILGLIIGFRKLKGNDESEEESTEGQTYY
jgi:uncharacterized membrane protein